jgi:hypothetical protein
VEAEGWIADGCGGDGERVRLMAAREEVRRKRGKRWRMHTNKRGNANGDDAWRWRSVEWTSRLHRLGNRRRH